MRKHQGQLDRKKKKSKRFFCSFHGKEGKRQRKSGLASLNDFRLAPSYLVRSPGLIDGRDNIDLAVRVG